MADLLARNSLRQNQTRHERGLHLAKREEALEKTREAMNSCNLSPPKCEADLLLGERLQQPSSRAVAAIIFFIIIHILTFPFYRWFERAGDACCEEKFPTEGPQVEHSPRFT